MTLAELRRKRDQILEIAHRYGVDDVRVFGSVVRGEAGPDSDIDLLIDAPSDIGIRIGGLLFDLRELLGPQVEIQTIRSIHDRILPTVLREAQRL